jgi:hypothetical protein
VDAREFEAMALNSVRAMNTLTDCDLHSPFSTSLLRMIASQRSPRFGEKTHESFFNRRRFIGQRCLARMWKAGTADESRSGCW